MQHRDMSIWVRLVHLLVKKTIGQVGLYIFFCFLITISVSVVEKLCSLECFDKISTIFKKYQYVTKVFTKGT